MKHVKYVGEAERRSKEMRQQHSNKAGFANGSRVKAYPEMEYGAGSGCGRLKKEENIRQKRQRANNHGHSVE